MNAGSGSWLFRISLGAGVLGGMLGMATGMFIVLAATTFVAALLYAISGFGFTVVAAPPFLLFLDPARAIQLVIIISTALSIAVVRGLPVAPRGGRGRRRSRGASRSGGQKGNNSAPRNEMGDTRINSPFATRHPPSLTRGTRPI